MTGLEGGTQNIKQKCLLRTETFCADVTVSIIEKDAGSRSCGIRILVGCNTRIDVSYTINQTSLLYSGRTFCGSDFEKAFCSRR